MDSYQRLWSHPRVLQFNHIPHNHHICEYKGLGLLWMVQNLGLWESLQNVCGMSFMPSLIHINPALGPHSPHQGPNYGPNQDQIFSAHGALHNAFTTSTAMSPNSFFTAINRISLTDTSFMVYEYVVYYVESTTCTPTNSLYLCRKSYCFTSEIICIGAYWQPSLF